MSTRANYDMQEKCARDARDWYKHAWEDVPTPGMQILSHYTNHYNARLGQCFILVGSTTFSKDKKTHKTNSTDSETLTDVLENRDLAAFDSFSGFGVMQCDVNGTHCSSKAEWDSLIRRYMEE